MNEIHPAVDATVLAEEKKKQQQQEERRLAHERLKAAEKERCLKRFKSSGKKLLWRAGAIVVIVLLLGIAQTFDLMARPLVNFLTATSCYWLAIQFGAWLQYVFCERGYTK